MPRLVAVLQLLLILTNKKENLLHFLGKVLIIFLVCVIVWRP
jgi:hypothetical protein